MYSETIKASYLSVLRQVSYAIPIILRCTVGRSRWRPGVWNLGSLSLPIAIISAIWQATNQFALLCTLAVLCAKCNHGFFDNSISIALSVSCILHTRTHASLL
jgi:hypothetical protein